MPTQKQTRVLDGPYANWDAEDTDCKFVLAASTVLRLGQPVAIDVTQLGPDQNVPNNSALPPQAEYCVATTSANAGPMFGVVLNVSNPPPGVTLSTPARDVAQWKNTNTFSVTLTVAVRQWGWGYVYAGAVSIASSGVSVLVGSNLITTSTQVFAIATASASTAINQGTMVGTALASAVNTNQSTPGGPASAATVISVIPNSLVGIVPPALVLIDSLTGGAQEQVSVGSISYPTFSVAVQNAHPAGFKITGPTTNPAKSSVLISTPGTGVTVAGLVATLIDIWA